MTFLQHIAKTSRFKTASARTLAGHGGFAARAERRFYVAQALHLMAPAAALHGDNKARNYIASDSWRGSGP